MVFSRKRDGEPKPVPAFWVWIASVSAVALSLFLWLQYPGEILIFGGNTIIYSGLLAGWIKSRRKKRHLSARVVERD
jgi:hypothetical protein